MAVTINYYPNESVEQLINLGTYAPNTTIRLTGAPANTKYVLRLVHDGITIADVRQAPNPNGQAVFSIGDILQSYVETNPAANLQNPFRSKSTENIYANSTLAKSREEIYTFAIHVGSDNGTTVTIDTIYSGFNAWNAIHPLYLMDYYQNTEFWQSTSLGGYASVDPESVGCTLPVTNDGAGTAITDRPLVNLLDLPGGIRFGMYTGTPAWLGHSIDVANVEAFLQGKDVDQLGFSLFWQNTLAPEYVQNPLLAYQTSLGAIRFDWYNGYILVGSNIIPNIQGNGGGPDTFPKEGLPAVYPFNTIGLKVGQTTTSQQRYRSNTGATLFQRPAGLTHYYVYPVATQDNACTSDFPGYSDHATHKAVRVNLHEDYFTGHLLQGKGMDLRGCTDYDPILFRWTNSAGYQDHAWFMKKNTWTKNTKRETFFRDQVDYSVDANNVPQFEEIFSSVALPQLRGTQIYNNTVEEVFTATTGWMSDEFAKYLQWMFQSSSVSADGYPVVLVTSSWTEKTFAKDKLYQYEVTYKKSSPINAQNR